MKNAVIIKSFPNGLSIFLDSELPFSQLLEEIAVKFSESANFFKDASMVLSFEGRVLSDQEERQIVDIISANSRLKIVCIMGKDEETERNFVKALQQLSFHQEVMENAGQFYKGTLKDGQILETENSIIVLGDVYPGACIISSKDIVVLGGLYGQAYAGGNGEEGHFVVALEMSPEKLKIGDFKYKTSEKQSKWSIKPKIQPKIAFVNDARVKIEPITKELLNDLPF
ncbi:MAG: septum site-determining protein MinC [Lachnospiraceae bacterium]|nr:septum site-determining protein MinC [Lachnospiraceae bacterium]RKI85267.1 septum site-determining protein MinC [bacterium 1xD42-87]